MSHEYPQDLKAMLYDKHKQRAQEKCRFHHDQERMWNRHYKEGKISAEERKAKTTPHRIAREAINSVFR